MGEFVANVQGKLFDQAIAGKTLEAGWFSAERTAFLCGPVRSCAVAEAVVTIVIRRAGRSGCGAILTEIAVFQ